MINNADHKPITHFQTKEAGRMLFQAENESNFNPWDPGEGGVRISSSALSNIVLSVVSRVMETIRRTAITTPEIRKGDRSPMRT